VSAISDSVGDPDYVQGLAKLGIVTLPHNTRFKK
jgi:hypothetical protein